MSIVPAKTYRNEFDLHSTISKLSDFVRKIGTKNLDIKGTRIVNAAASVNPNDYVIRDELKVLQGASPLQINSLGGSGAGVSLGIPDFKVSHSEPGFLDIDTFRILDPDDNTKVLIDPAIDEIHFTIASVDMSDCSYSGQAHIGTADAADGTADGTLILDDTRFSHRKRFFQLFSFIVVVPRNGEGTWGVYQIIGRGSGNNNSIDPALELSEIQGGLKFQALLKYGSDANFTFLFNEPGPSDGDCYLVDVDHYEYKVTRKGYTEDIQIPTGFDTVANKKIYSIMPETYPRRFRILQPLHCILGVSCTLVKDNVNGPIATQVPQNSSSVIQGKGPPVPGLYIDTGVMYTLQLAGDLTANQISDNYLSIRFYHGVKCIYGTLTKAGISSSSNTGLVAYLLGITPPKMYDKRYVCLYAIISFLNGALVSYATDDLLGNPPPRERTNPYDDNGYGAHIDSKGFPFLYGKVIDLYDNVFDSMGVLIPGVLPLVATTTKVQMKPDTEMKLYVLSVGDTQAPGGLTVEFLA